MSDVERPRTYFVGGEELVVQRGELGWTVEFRGRRAQHAHLDLAVAAAVGVEDMAAIFLARQILEREPGIELERL